MVKFNYQLLEFDHVVEFIHDHTLFAAARDTGNGHSRLFLINEDSGRVYTRNGRADSWEQLFDHDREWILARVEAARHNHIPVYKINGDSGAHN